ncbi:cardiolipin synthase [Bythopirellula polymerisocia]|uniref:Cardiolipin synthase n=1 Tax=Bythopirellula polymerisocia TaxID=2528003 RepID=A0A5C6CIM0_9BACT|nr:cardiolipin synthase [Bythopirellula polymerisocia]TWU24633.1 Cardiolipin synthase [Bythopirellula polymerisocia]
MLEYLKHVHWPVYLLLILAHLAVQVMLALRMVMRRRPVGETLSWVLIIFGFPVIGPALYVILGELKLGQHRVLRSEKLLTPFRDWLAGLENRFEDDQLRLTTEHKQLAQLGQRAFGLPVLPGNQIELIDNWQAVFEHLISDIDTAQSTCHLEFYIWHLGGEANKVAEALIRASQRGVDCRVLLDAMGSRPFLRSPLANEMREAGVHIQEALAGGLMRVAFVRLDIRLHRKIVVIDGKVAYTGSLNLVDPRYFKKDSGVGQWVDAMVRLQGPTVEPLAITFLSDWFVESSEQLEDLQNNGDASPQPKIAEAAVQILPSGPGHTGGSIEQVLVTAVYAAQKELILTTPYFVPDDSLLMGLASAAERGVKVILIVPKKVDSRLVRYASQAFKGDLLKAGVRIANFGGGLLHTKSVTVDGEFSLFGSLNLDPRSLRVNFEISLAIYNREFTVQLRKLQQEYLDQSELMDLAAWENRPTRQRVAENFARLVGPLL